MNAPGISVRDLGTSGLRVSAIGLGCMGMSQSYGHRDDAESIATIHHALDRGVSFLDTSDIYAEGANEELIARALRGRRDHAVVATKFGVTYGPERQMLINGRPEFVHASCEASLRRLDTDYIDLYYQHRVDPTVPIEETVGAMAELVDAGKIRFIGLSEASASTIARASSVHQISALESEWSLWTRDLETEVLDACRAHGVGVVPFSPLGRGFLTGAITSPDDFDDDDFRKNHPRFQGENFYRNLELVEKVREIAEGKGVTAGQLALAWVLARGSDVVPIPGTKRRTYLDENIAALDVELTADELRALDTLAPVGVAAGGRYANPQGYGESVAREAYTSAE